MALARLRSFASALWRREDAPSIVGVDLQSVCSRLSLSALAGPSPLQRLPTVVTEGGETVPLTSTDEKGVARAVYRQLPISSKKLTPVAKLVRKMRVEDALLQCDLVHKKGALIVQNAIRSARANGIHNHGLDGSKLFVEHCYATNGQDLKRIKFHGRGRHGKVRRRRTHLTVILREDPEERPRPHRIQPSWLQRQNRDEKGEPNPSASRHRETKVLAAKLKWKTQMRKLRRKKKEERQKAKEHSRHALLSDTKTEQ